MKCIFYNNSKPQCVQSLYTELQLFAAGKESYRVAANFIMTNCGNAITDILLIDYTCIPGLSNLNC